MILKNIFEKLLFYSQKSFSPSHYNELPSNDLTLINVAIFSSNLYYKEINEPLLFFDTGKNLNQ